MDKDKQDIYEMQQPENANGAGDGKNETGAAPNRLASQFKHSSIIFRLTIIIFMLTLGLFVIHQARTNRPANSIGDKIKKPHVTIGLRSDSVLDFGHDLQNQLIMDELNDIEIGAIPDGKTIPLNIYWVKQAAVHLLKAERAYNLQQWDEAINHYNEVLTIFPEIEDVEVKLGLCYIRIEDYATSIESFSNAVTQTTNSYRIINNIGVAYLSNKDFEKAEQCFLRVLETKHDYSPAYHNLAMLYSRTEMYAEAAQEFEKYFALVTSDISAKQTYTKVLIKLERWDDAKKVLKESIKKLPKAAPLYMALAQVMSHSNDEDERDKAMSYLMHGVSLLDRSAAITMLGSPEFDLLRPREDFKELMNKLTMGIE